MKYQISSASMVCTSKSEAPSHKARLRQQLTVTDGLSGMTHTVNRPCLWLMKSHYLEQILAETSCQCRATWKSKAAVDMSNAIIFRRPKQHHMLVATELPTNLVYNTWSTSLKQAAMAAENPHPGQCCLAPGSVAKWLGKLQRACRALSNVLPKGRRRLYDAHGTEIHSEMSGGYRSPKDLQAQCHNGVCLFQNKNPCPACFGLIVSHKI